MKCGECAKVCPTNAINVNNILEEPTELVPTHKYPNEEEKEDFRLYNLPTLLLGKFSGLCGLYEIGKNTALNIISRKLKSNFGNSNLKSNQI